MSMNKLAYIWVVFFLYILFLIFESRNTLSNWVKKGYIKVEKTLSGRYIYVVEENKQKDDSSERGWSYTKDLNYKVEWRIPIMVKVIDLPKVSHVKIEVWSLLCFQSLISSPPL